MMQNRIHSLILLCMMILISSCHRENIDSSLLPSEYFIRFKIDGVEKFYNRENLFCLVNSFDSINNQWVTSIICSADPNDGDRNSIFILIGHQTPLAANTIYTNYTTSQANTVQAQTFWLSYNDENGNHTFNFDEALFSSTGAISDAHFQLTGFNANTTSGTFSCSLYDTTFTNPIHTLTNGEFYLPHQ